MDTSQNTGKKRTTLIVALAACLVLAVGAGVFAWFSAQDTKTNTFVQGDGITEPEKKPDPGKPEGGGESGKDPVDPTDHFIIETEWTDKSPIVPGGFVPKNPNVGINAASKPAYVFVDVDNGLGDGAYFVLGSKWKAVEAVAYTGPEFDATLSEDDKKRCYKSGLFVYVGDQATAQLLTPTGTPDTDIYTGEVFDYVYANKSFAELQGEKTIEVKSFMVAASSDTENMEQKLPEITEKAKAWAKGN